MNEEEDVWYCPFCTFGNSRSTNKCEMGCGENPETSEGLRASRDILSMSLNGWFCEACTMRNQEEASVCTVCETPKPSADGTVAPTQLSNQASDSSALFAALFSSSSAQAAAQPAAGTLPPAASAVGGDTTPVHAGGASGASGASGAPVSDFAPPPSLGASFDYSSFDPDSGFYIDPVADFRFFIHDIIDGIARDIETFLPPTLNHYSSLSSALPPTTAPSSSVSSVSSTSSASSSSAASASTTDILSSSSSSSSSLLLSSSESSTPTAHTDLKGTLLSREIPFLVLPVAGAATTATTTTAASSSPCGEVGAIDSETKIWQCVGQFHGCEGGRVYGGDDYGFYTSDSNKCSAGLHMGILRADTGGQLLFRPAPHRQVWNSCLQNGIETLGWSSGWDGMQLLPHDAEQTPPSASQPAIGGGEASASAAAASVVALEPLKTPAYLELESRNVSIPLLSQTPAIKKGDIPIFQFECYEQNGDNTCGYHALFNAFQVTSACLSARLACDADLSAGFLRHLKERVAFCHFFQVSQDLLLTHAGNLSETSWIWNVELIETGLLERAYASYLLQNKHHFAFQLTNKSYYTALPDFHENALRANTNELTVLRRVNSILDQFRTSKNKLHSFIIASLNHWVSITINKVDDAYEIYFCDSVNIPILSVPWSTVSAICNEKLGRNAGQHLESLEKNLFQLRFFSDCLSGKKVFLTECLSYIIDGLLSDLDAKVVQTEERLKTERRAEVEALYEWSCPTCTLGNEGNSATCAACDSPRPNDVVPVIEQGDSEEIRCQAYGLALQNWLRNTIPVAEIENQYLPRIDGLISYLSQQDRLRLENFIAAASHAVLEAVPHATDALREGWRQEVPAAAAPTAPEAISPTATATATATATPTPTPTLDIGDLSLLAQPAPGTAVEPSLEALFAAIQQSNVTVPAAITTASGASSEPTPVSTDSSAFSTATTTSTPSTIPAAGTPSPASGASADKLSLQELQRFSRILTRLSQLLGVGRRELVTSLDTRRFHFRSDHGNLGSLVTPLRGDV